MTAERLWGEPLGRFFKGVSGLLCAAMFAFTSAAANDGYTINGAPMAREMGQLLAQYGFEPGAYYIDELGNYGRSGQPPVANFNGGPPRGWRGVEPRSVGNNPYALAYRDGVRRVRVYWIFSPGIGSVAKGGSSGYYHICPRNIFYKTSESAFSVGGGYNSQRGGNNPSAGAAGTAQGSGRWSIESGPQGPVLALFDNTGARRVPVATMLQGKWKYNQFTYVAEVGAASCPG